MKAYVVVQQDMYGDLKRIIGVADSDETAQLVIEGTKELIAVDCPWEMPVYFNVLEFEVDE